MSEYGKRMYGYVDRLEGFGEVRTQFFHFSYVPFVPLGSYIVLDGQETDEEFLGKRIPLNLKSILAGYIRGWFGLVAFVGFSFGFAMAGVCLGGLADGAKDALEMICFFGPAVAGMGLTLYVIKTRSRWWVPVQVAMLVVSGALWLILAQREQTDPAWAATAAKYPENKFVLAVANLALLVVSAARRWSVASPERALELIVNLDLSPEISELLIYGERGRRPPLERKLDQRIKVS
jgi:hypothetical protein